MSQKFKKKQVKRNFESNLRFYRYMNDNGKLVTGNAAVNHLISQLGGIDKVLSSTAKEAYDLGQYDMLNQLFDLE